MNKLRQQVIDSMREYSQPNSAPPWAGPSMIAGMLIYAAKAGILTEAQYRRLQRVNKNIRKANQQKDARVMFHLTYFIQAPSPTFARRPAKGPTVADHDRSRLLMKAEGMMGEYCKAHPEFRPYHSDEWEWLAEPLLDKTAESFVIYVASS